MAWTIERVEVVMHAPEGHPGRARLRTLLADGWEPYSSETMRGPRDTMLIVHWLKKLPAPDAAKET